MQHRKNMQQRKKLVAPINQSYCNNRNKSINTKCKHLIATKKNCLLQQQTKSTTTTENKRTVRDATTAKKLIQEKKTTCCNGENNTTTIIKIKNAMRDAS
jgi:hypothetical protein